MLCTMPLQSLLDWLSKPKGPNLVEASVAAVPEKALVLAVTKKMLYVREPPLVGVGLMYKPHYVSTVPFSATCMQLNVWYSAGSDKESGDKLTALCLLFVSISEMSDVIPVAVQHPVLLDVTSKEAWRTLVSLCLLFPSGVSGSILSGPSNPEGFWLVISLSHAS